MVNNRIIKSLFFRDLTDPVRATSLTENFSPTPEVFSEFDPGFYNNKCEVQIYENKWVSIIIEFWNCYK